MARIIACSAKCGSQKGFDRRELITTDMMLEENELSRTKPYGRWPRAVTVVIDHKCGNPDARATKTRYLPALPEYA